MAELVDARDLKSLGSCNCASSILAPGTRNFKGLQLFDCNPFSFAFFRVCNSCVNVKKTEDIQIAGMGLAMYHSFYADGAELTAALCVATSIL